MDLSIVRNNAIEYYLSVFRNKTTSSGECRHCVDMISLFLAGEISNYLRTESKEIRTPLGNKDCKIISEEIVLIPVLRAGIAMLSSFQDVLPMSDVGFIWAHRDENAQAIYDKHKFPADVENKTFIIIDTMLATAGTINLAADISKKYKPNKILCASVLSTRYGIDHLADIIDGFVTTGIEDTLDEKRYVSPGVGDSGDRLYG